jgi:hypothetical protein
MIEELKDCGLPVSYCKTICSYYYTEDVKIDFRMAIGEQEMSKITGGTTHVNDAEKKAKDFFHTANFLPPDFGTLTPYWPIRDH